MTDNLLGEIKRRIILPVLQALDNMGRMYHGLLYAGVMLPEDGGPPQLLEFNCRFGDPETQVVVPRLKTDLVDLMLGSLTYKGLSGFQLEVEPEAAVCVVAASAQYPGKPLIGFPITILPVVHHAVHTIFHAGTERDGHDRLVTSGGRVAVSIGMADTHESARGSAYAGLSGISFEGMQSRSDIAEGV